jgi:hypothetical protein
VTQLVRKRPPLSLRRPSLIWTVTRPVVRQTFRPQKPPELRQLAVLLTALAVLTSATSPAASRLASPSELPTFDLQSPACQASPASYAKNRGLSGVLFSSSRPPFFLNAGKLARRRYSHLKTFDESAVHKRKTNASTATSPECAAHGSPLHTP